MNNSLLKTIIVLSFITFLIYYWIMYSTILHNGSFPIFPFHIKNLFQLILILVITFINYFFMQENSESNKAIMTTLIIIYTVSHLIGTFGYYIKTGETIFHDPMSMFFSFLFYIYGLISLIVSNLIFIFIWKVLFKRCG